MTLFQLLDLLFVAFLLLSQFLVPHLVVLFEMIKVFLFALLESLSVHEDEFFLLSVEFLFTQFSQSVFGHFSLYETALCFTLEPMFVHRNAINGSECEEERIGCYMNSEMLSALISL